MNNTNNTARAAQKSFSLHDDCMTYIFAPVSATRTTVIHEGDGEEMSRETMPVEQARAFYRSLVADGFSKGY